VSKRKKPTIVEVAGPANIHTVTEIHGKLQQGLQESGAVELRVDRAADVDLTFVQLVESARSYATAESKVMALSAPAGADLRDVLQRGGFLAAAGDRAFWLHEAEGR
jgi:hypothetical protein